MKKGISLAFVFAAASGCGADVKREDWTAHVESQLPILMCANPSFSICYQEGRFECEAVATPLVRECIKREEVPLDFPQRRRSHWGKKVGECVG